ncbi:MAG: hypothetical protein WD532_09175 [Acidimicrobiia bacterium]
MSKPGQQLLRVVLGIVLALGVIVALRLVGQWEFAHALAQRDWSEARLIALGFVILGAALAGAVRLPPLIPGTASLVLAVLYGGVLVTESFAWQAIFGVPTFNQAVVHTFSSSTMFVVIGLLAAAAVWGLFEKARPAERSQSSD